MLSITQSMLLQISEEAKELAIECDKAIRFGLHNFHPNEPAQDNIDRIVKEYTQLVAAIDIFNEEHGDQIGQIDDYLEHYKLKQKQFRKVSQDLGLVQNYPEEGMI